MEKKSTKSTKLESPKLDNEKKAPVKVEAAAGSNQLREDFEKLISQFLHLEDPVARYMKRQEMKDLQEKLKAQGVNVDVP
jgi:hypothetical protein